MSFMSVYNKYNNNKPKLQPLKRNIKSTALYSNELVRDFIKVANCRTVKECNTLALESLNNIRALEFLIRQNNTDYRNRRIRISKMKKYSVEAANVLYSMEEENKSENWFRDFMKKISLLWQQFLVLCANIGRNITIKINYIRANFSSKLVDNFKPENFQNINATIKVHDVNIDNFYNLIMLVDQKVKKEVSEDDKILDEVNKANDEAIADAEKTKDYTPEQLQEHLRNKQEQEILADNKLLEERLATSPYSMICEGLYGQESRPKKVEKTVGEYLNCKAGERPKALELISKQRLQEMKKYEEDVKKLMNDLKKELNTQKRALDVAEKNNKNTNFYKTAMKGFNLAKLVHNHTFEIIKWYMYEQLAIISDIATAIATGLKSPK